MRNRARAGSGRAIVGGRGRAVTTCVVQNWGMGIEPRPAEIGGLHHVTAITGDAPGNLTFYRGGLGMRLVKRTVNQDDVAAYHLFYADGRGTPGTDLTFFDWPLTPVHRPGVGTIGPISLRVADVAALDHWAGRLDRLGVAHGPIGEPDGLPSISFTDPEGQRLELVAAGAPADGAAWAEGPVAEAHQVRGLHAVTLTEARLDPTAALLVDVLGFRAAGERALPAGAHQVTFEVGRGGPGTEVRVVLPGAGAVRGQPGTGGVHHVALRVADAATQEAWRRVLEAAGLGVTPVIDRFWFRSIYFREPGGTLFEIATDGPGFAADEAPEHLGESLVLPPFLEGRRAQIVAGLRPLE